MIMGKQSIQFDKPAFVMEAASVVGQKEGEGPLKNDFDLVIEDAMAGMNTWEEAESEFQKAAVEKVLEKARLRPKDIRYVFAGDLLGQLIATSFGMEDFAIPLIGLYGACSTFGEALGLSAMTVSGGHAKSVLAVASSHFASAEKQFRYPLEYGNQRPASSTWTVTGCGAAIVTSIHQKVCITGVTTGKIVDWGIKDSMNMGACMAPAAADLILSNFRDFDRKPEDYSMIITGDLGFVGREILLKLLGDKGVDISHNYTDCGIQMFDKNKQDTQSGGSGCGCSAVTFAALIMKKIISGQWKRVLFIPTGALLSTISYNEGKSVPGIAHGVVLERSDDCD